MHSTHCLNCEQPLSGNFCQHCGQKADTHRLSMKHFFLHDMVHGFWHLEKGILFSLKGILLKPGKTIRDYIAGKRTGHFNIITLLLLLAGLLFYVGNKQYTDNAPIALGSLDLTEFVHHYNKFILLSVVPLLAFVSFIVFRRLRYNYTEHLLVYCYYLIAVIVAFIILGLFNWATNIKFNGTIDYIKLASVPLLLGWITAQCFLRQYSIAGWLWRFLAMIFLIIIVTIVAGLIIAAIAQAVTGRGVFELN